MSTRRKIQLRETVTGGDPSAVPSATLIVLHGLGADGQDFAPLAPACQRIARAVVLIGRDAPAIHTALAGSSVTAASTAARLSMAKPRWLKSPSS